MSDKDIEFVDGLFWKDPRSQAPDYVKGSISIQPDKLAAWCKTHAGEEWVNVDVKESKGGKVYCAVNDWKPDDAQKQRRQGRKSEPEQAGGGFADDDIPFRAHNPRVHW